MGWKKRNCEKAVQWKVCTIEGKLGLHCDVRDRWVYRSCEKMNNELYEELKEYEGVIWLCRMCKDELLEDKGEVKKAKKEDEDKK